MKKAALPALVTLCWLALTGAGMWQAAVATHEPPTMDPLTYAQKAQAFWAGVADAAWVNPLNIQPTVRPPGTIAMSYPLGFTTDFHGYYFRSVFWPLLLLAASVYIAGFSSALSQRGHWALAGLAVALSGAPMLFQFQSNEVLPAASFWGLTDGFLAGMAAVAMASAVRAAHTLSVRWAVAAALAAAFCLMIKPAGLLVMGLVGVAWFALAASRFRWSLATLNALPQERAAFVQSLSFAIGLYLLAFIAAFGSAYFSASNMAFGKGALAVMKSELTLLAQANLAVFGLLLKISVGYAIPAVIAVGMAVAVVQQRFATVVLSVLCLVAGLWFWAVESGLEVVRYFLPFPAMVFVLLAARLVPWLEGLSTRAVGPLIAAVAAPGLMATALLFTPNPPVGAQRALGLNLIVDAYGPENRQAADVLAQAQRAGLTHAEVYFFDATPPLRNFYAVIEYAGVAAPAGPRLLPKLPRDWQRASSFRLEDMTRARYLAFEPIHDAAQRQEILSQHKIDDFNAETRVMNAWASELGEAQGVAVVSETRVRVFEIFDAPKFEAAFAQLVAGREWPQTFRDANQKRWWSQQELNALPAAVGLTRSAVKFQSAMAEEAVTIRAVHPMPQGAMFDVNVWVDANTKGQPNQPWVLFGHLVNAAGETIGNAQVNVVGMAPSSAEASIYRYVLSYTSPPSDAVAVALGFFKPNNGSLDFMTADSGQRDWDGRRLIIPLL